jgi:serine phosphatase RsbU (regulator of sigma subunit)/AmiR/NasT family two-component response regulator
MAIHFERDDVKSSNLFEQPEANVTGTILVVDDMPDNLRLLESLLKNKGFQVVKATNGPEALSLLGLVQPDVVFLDIMMPEMDGFEVTRRIRAINDRPYIPIVLLTAIQDNKARLEGLEAGADEFLTKPFSAPELVTRARSLIRLRRYNQALIQSIEDNRYLNDLLLRENERMANELERTREAQLRLMPQDGPAHVSFAAHYKPALEVGGDYYDYMPLNDHTYLVLLGDAVGKGGAAVLSVAIIKSVIATEFDHFKNSDFDPAKLLNRINRIICGPLQSSHTEMTLFCGIVDLQERRITYSNAGQTFPYLVRPGFLQELKLSGLPIGLFEDAEYSIKEINFQPGDRLILYSDGINEATNLHYEEFGHARLEAAILQGANLTPDLLLNRVLVGLHDFCKDATDDQTMVVFGF